MDKYTRYVVGDVLCWLLLVNVLNEKKTQQAQQQQYIGIHAANDWGAADELRGAPRKVTICLSLT